MLQIYRSSFYLLGGLHTITLQLCNLALPETHSVVPLHVMKEKQWQPCHGTGLPGPSQQKQSLPVQGQQRCHCTTH